MAINISKTSGVLFVTDGTNKPTAYYNSSGSYQLSDDGSYARVTIYFGQNQRAEMNIAVSNLKVNGQTPSTSSEAQTLLNAVFGN